MGAPDLYRGPSVIERVHLTGETTAAGQRAWCDVNDIRCGRRQHVDECSIWLDERIDALLDGFRDPAIGSYGGLGVPRPHAAAVAA